MILKALTYLYRKKKISLESNLIELKYNLNKNQIKSSPSICDGFKQSFIAGHDI